MNPEFLRAMRDAARLTGGGDLAGATAAIQQALSRGTAVAPGGADAPHSVLDVEEIEEIVWRDVDAPPSGEGRIEAGTYSASSGARAYKLYVPPQAGTAALPLVVMLHGCTQNADDFARGTAMNDLAKAQGFYVLYPEQSDQANPQRCWNWFKHSHQERGRGEPALLSGMTRKVIASHRIDTRRVFVAGLSAGGAMAAIVAETYPELFAAAGVHSGLATGVASDLPSALGAMQRGPQGAPQGANGVPTIVFHGDADRTVHPGNGERVISASAAAGAGGVEVEHGVARGGRRYTRHVHRASAGGAVLAEHWVIHGAPHAWSGGRATGSHTDPAGPDASAEMVRFFLERAPAQPSR
jgi:poly(hydroxyalkanoate) depolymerase family esterase